MQSPTEVVMKILLEGLTNSKQVPLMVEVLECLNPVLSVCELDKMAVASGNEKMSIVTSLLSSVMKNDLSDLEKSNFVNLVGVICFWYCLSVTLFWDVMMYNLVEKYRMFPNNCMFRAEECAMQEGRCVDIVQ